MKGRYRKEVTKFYKGQAIVKNSAYSFRGYNVILFYCPIQGTELYFKSIGKAKRYLDSVQNVKVTKDDLPF